MEEFIFIIYVLYTVIKIVKFSENPQINLIDKHPYVFCSKYHVYSPNPFLEISKNPLNILSENQTNISAFT